LRLLCGAVSDDRPDIVASLSIDAQVLLRLPCLVRLLLVPEPLDLIFDGTLSSTSAPFSLPFAGAFYVWVERMA